jgi:hypothetical protein
MGKKSKYIKATKSFTDEDGNWFIEFKSKDVKKIIKKYGITKTSNPR